ncbi:MAG: hypothetical protein FWD68_19100 [Alphaproteobacteria bacterium]|nr:hypothetical protein [Alphaproteobacteria bacterium]
MKMFRVVVLGLLVGGPAFAQMPHINLMADGPGKTEEERAADAEKEKAYRDSLKKIPDAKASSNDPWGGMRSEPAKSSPAKPAKSSAKKTTKGAVN